MSHIEPCTPLISASKLSKTFHKGAIEVPVLNDVDLSVAEGEMLSIIGQSGSGKSTLLHLLATLDRPDSGEVHFQGNRIDNLAPAGRDVLRNKYIGLIFQFYHLLPELTTLENVLAPMMIRHSAWGYLTHRRQYRERARALLDTVGLSHRLNHKPSELSGGEMQRTAIARALIADPVLLLADEPTGNLDQRSGEEILDVLGRLNDERQLTVVMVTHDTNIAARADRTIQLVDGRVNSASQAAA